MGRAPTALVLLGLQHDVCDPRGALAAAGGDVSGMPAMLGAAARVLEAARTAGAPIVHAPEQALAGGLSDSRAWRAQLELNGLAEPPAAEGTWGEEIVAGFEPREDELVVPRHRPGALYDTRASVLLRSARVRRLVLVGAETHRAVLATAVQAVSLDFEVIVPVDAVAAADPLLGVAAVQVLGSWARVAELEAAVEELVERVEA